VGGGTQPPVDPVVQEITDFIATHTIDEVMAKFGVVVPKDATVTDMGGGTYMIQEPASQADWLLKDNSVVMASIYAPTVDQFLIQDDSALYGRLLTTELKMTRQSAVFYDHSLDNGGGYTNPFSALFEDDGSIKVEITSQLASLDIGIVEAVAAAAGLAINLQGQVYGDISENVAEAEPIPGQPTPRPVPVDYTIVVFGTDVQAWEDAAAQ
jgi:hypothetical protein